MPWFYFLSFLCTNCFLCTNSLVIFFATCALSTTQIKILQAIPIISSIICCTSSWQPPSCISRLVQNACPETSRACAGEPIFWIPSLLILTFFLLIFKNHIASSFLCKSSEKWHFFLVHAYLYMWCDYSMCIQA